MTMDMGEQTRLVSMVATADKASLDPKAVLAAVKSFLDPDDPEPTLVDTDSAETRSFVITVGPHTVAVLLMPFAIPAETLDDALGNELGWPEARGLFAKSQGHVLLAVINPNTDASQLVNQARLLTVVTAAVLEAGQSLGVYWSTAERVIAPDKFTAEARDMLGSQFAPSLWFGLRYYPGPDFDQDNKLVCQSSGLAVFQGRELECGPYLSEPGPLAEMVLGVARYMATQGQIFAPGHTFGFGSQESKDARLEFGWSPLGGVNRPVFKLVLLNHDPAGAQ